MRKCATVYISDKHKHVVISRKYQNDAGIIYEQDDCFTSSYPADADTLGAEVINSLNLYAVRDKDLREHNLTDWPAYKHSKCRSVISFEKEYITLQLRSANESNLILIIEGHPFKDSILTVNSAVSLYADHDEIGERIHDVYMACLTGKLS